MPDRKAFAEMAAHLFPPLIELWVGKLGAWLDALRTTVMPGDSPESVLAKLASLAAAGDIVGYLTKVWAATVFFITPDIILVFA